MYTGVTMIASLRGTVRYIHDTFLILECQGVGYRVSVLPSVRTRVRVGSPLELFTHQHIREDAAELYGFREIDELLLFEQVIGVSGVGPKLGLGVLSLASVPKLIAAIAHGDAAQLTKVSGIGKKTAERIIVDLREKVGGTGELPQLHAEDVDAIDVLMRLGYTQHEARDALRQVSADIHGTEERIRAALTSLGRTKAA